MSGSAETAAPRTTAVGWLALSVHPLVPEVAGVGAGGDKWGEAPAAFVTVHPGQQLDPAQLRQFASTRLAGFKVGRHVEIVSQLLKTRTGKIEGFILRERAASRAAQPPGADRDAAR